MQNIGQRSTENKHGKITGYYPDGTVKSVDTYEKGVPLGPCESYYPDGKLISSKNFTLYFNSTKQVCMIATGKSFTGKLNKTGIVGKYLFPNLDTKTFLLMKEFFPLKG